ncbi:hypothetical protein B9Z55_006800 [Caenorhabditis nigoni]|uniref:Uncharacterized protein n=2 Tax=Caenorhabditis nigoni TaxID=1611254 RepID=A0A2G5V6L8_9PELO|nr:hypothetical protein B9Z55_006800 [Caenorhabditis nigoni]
MHQEIMLLIVTLPFFASLTLVNCLKAHWKFKGDELKEAPSEAYVKTVSVKERKPQKTEKRVKKTEVKDNKKGKKLAKFFIFNGKEEDLKTPNQSLSLDSTQDSDEEHESPLGSSYEFSGDEKLKGIQLLPSPRPGMIKELKAEARRMTRGQPSERDNCCYSDEEDSLFNIESLMHDPATLKSCQSGVPLEIQDSRILRVNQDRLGYKKSHTTYAQSSMSPYSRRLSSTSSDDSATTSDQITVIHNI